MSRFAYLTDKPQNPEPVTGPTATHRPTITSDLPPSRVGRNAISGYFSPEMSLAMHLCAGRNGVSLQALMAEAFDDVLRKNGESPVGD